MKKILSLIIVTLATSMTLTISGCGGGASVKPTPQKNVVNLRGLEGWNKFYKGDNRMTSFCQVQLNSLKNICLKEEKWKKHGSCKNHALFVLPYYKGDKRIKLNQCGL